MAVATTNYVNAQPVRVQYGPVTWLVLGVLLVGPLVGPVFSQIGWPILGLINWPIYLMGENVCPTPDLSFQVFGYPMVVCSRCWSGVFGLWIVLLAYKAAPGTPVWGAWRRLPDLAAVGLALLAFAPWVLDLIAYDQRWWLSPTWVQMLT